MSERVNVGLASVLVSFCAIFILFGVGAPLLSRVASLRAHLQSGDWTVSGGVASADEAIRAKYPQPSREWKISYLAGSGRSYALDDASRADTIQQLGNYAYRSHVVADQIMGRLSSEYASLVAVSAKGSGINPATWAEAKRALDAFSDDRGDEFDAFPVDTQPSYDNLAAWDLAAVSLPQSSRCRGTVSGLRSGTPIDADLSIQPRYVALPIQRPWFTPALLTQAAISSNPAIRNMVVGGGPLAEIPAEIWVSLPQKITVSAIDGNGQSELGMLAKSGDCCNIECLGVQMKTTDGTARLLPNKTVAARIPSPSPAVYAIVSHRQPTH